MRLCSPWLLVFDTFYLFVFLFCRSVQRCCTRIWRQHDPSWRGGWGRRFILKWFHPTARKGGFRYDQLTTTTHFAIPWEVVWNKGNKCVVNRRTVRVCFSRSWRCPCISVVPKATHEASLGPLKGVVSTQKALQGSETETREELAGCEKRNRTSWG